MALTRGKYGIEFNPRPDDSDSTGLGWIIAVVSLVALVSLVWTLVARFRASGDEEDVPVTPSSVETAPPVEVPDAAPKAVDPPLPAVGTPREVIAPTKVKNRSVKVRNLILRLEEAEKAHDVEMAASTIEQLREEHGVEIADLDNSFARRLGDLNYRRLFRDHHKLWVTEVSVKSGDSASRIASEHGSTLTSLMKLSSLTSADRLRVGQRLLVMNHPRFALVVHRRQRIADLQLNGKFFRRYDLADGVRAPEGDYTTTANLRSFLSAKGLVFKPADRAELELLLPAKTSVVVSEL